MNLIEALKAANGKPVKRSIGKLSLIVGTCDSLCWFNPTGDSTIAYGMYCSDILADDWYVVEPKSPTEEAIEREVVEFYNRPMNEVESTGGKIPQILRRIVNLTLDEAKKAVSASVLNEEAKRRIDALKVKE